MDTLKMKAEAAEECACALVRGLGNSRQPFTPKLDERVAENLFDVLPSCPSRIDGHKADLDVRMTVLREDGCRNKRAVADDAQSPARPEI